MNFIITRTSSCCTKDSKPYKDAILVETDDMYAIDERTTSDPKLIPFYRNNPEKAEKEWYYKGKNHRVESGHIVRDVRPHEQHVWMVEVNHLHDLFDIIDGENESVIVSNSQYRWKDDNPEQRIPEIEIYDGYRE